MARTLVAMGLMFVLGMTGCEKPPYDMAPVHGTVTVDGHMLKQGKVMFTPKSKAGELNSGKPAYGRIQPDGVYVLYTYGDDDGAIVGEHGVTVINTSTDADAPKFRQVSLPKPFKVEAGKENEINIELTKLEVAQYGR